jgi:hypothetical protein
VAYNNTEFDPLDQKWTGEFFSPLDSPAVYTAEDYLKLAGYTAAWLAIPVGLAAGTAAATGGAVMATAKAAVSLTAPPPSSPEASLPAAPAAGAGLVTAPPSASWWRRLLAFAFPKGAP